MDNIILLPCSEDELLEKIRLLVRAELQGIKPSERTVSCAVPGLTQKPIFKAAEVCQMLQISRQTLHMWVKEGLLHAYKIKSRVFFLQTDIERLIQQTGD